MILHIVGVTVATFLFFASLYFTSRNEGVKSLMGGILGVASIILLAICLVLLFIPNFFSGG